MARVLGRVLLPALAMIPANPGVSNEVWNLLQLLPYAMRFDIYREFNLEAQQQPLLQAANNLAVVEVKKVARRLHAPKSEDRR